MAVDHSLGDGVFFRSEDYAGFTRRVVVMMIDSTVLLFFASGLLVAQTMVETFWVDEDLTTYAILIAVGISWLYLTVVKRSRLRTIGYRLADVRITSIKGDRPSLLKMTFRMLLWAFGPVNFLVDLVWIAADRDHQTIRDCLAGTYVIRQDARPIGTAPLHLTRYCGAGLTLAYPRPVHPDMTRNQTEEGSIES
ncbi:RDD family protein [Aporhodopirellula aestuarii]|uniref:RDD family protein n=1 Tax=Aporhodopirellula aestuarii TaxID=2950107 RepID=A0ABT0U366_9BACT|nr:RDD family protein [Aporhodopirellula aestuarii]MCM2371324.1 RDD family protein [Aporhodopirellula aestuarii]